MIVMSKRKKIVLGLLAVAVLALASQFVYYNVIVPWPYRHELQACLEEANNQQNEQAVEEARDKCFRTYPHFN